MAPLLTPTRRAVLLAALAQPAARRAIAETRSTPLLKDVVAQTLAATDDARVAYDLVLRPDTGIETRDVQYPDWCLGKWKVKSSLQQVLAPAGDVLFSPGRNGTESLRRAREEIGTPPLEYECRWQRDGEGWVVVDRAYNVASISKASMGQKAVQYIEEDGPDHQTLVLAPAGAPKGLVYKVDLRVVSRHADAATTEAGFSQLCANQRCVERFDCAETVRQTVIIVPGGANARVAPPPAVKEVETICLYERLADGRMVGYQRTSTFLVPDAAYTSESPFIEQQAARLLRTRSGRLIANDVRCYQLEYVPVADI